MLAIVVLASILIIRVIGILSLSMTVAAVAVVVLALGGLLRVTGHHGQQLKCNVQTVASCQYGELGLGMGRRE